MRSVHLRALCFAAVTVAVVSIAAAVARRASISSTAQPSMPSAAISALRAAPPPSVASSPSAAAVLTDPSPLEPARCPPEPALEVRVADLPPAAELLRLAREKPEALGSASIGSPTRGALFGGVEMKNSEGIVRAGAYGWGTDLVIRSIERAVREVRRCFPGSPSLHVGDIARERGGWLRPHRSHQSGLDADIGYYYQTPAIWYQHATAENLDVARTWALVRALIEGDNVEMIFMDVSVQRLVQAHMTTLPHDARPPEDLFESPAKKDAIIRHAWGHATHFHVRFQDPAAVALGQRLADTLPRFRAMHRAPPRRPIPPVRSRPSVGIRPNHIHK